ncbi:DUF2252 domain-containing protein [Streptomyces antimicrobicus]|uniref:DUF2252 domain-containing protein n=1 Tax=Streptomyces antimicrobicus TaxID=2883108 RepID=A0ABS8B4B2_9ACTN|nr:DUF2252 domain-containing protein [Streptomyces antimicrobicus]MCB5179421.1 DUF2252 domain-containing protein [Streptomyces antimicrobicus]
MTEPVTVQDSALTPAARARRGKAARARVRRSEQALLGPGSARQDPVRILAEESAARVQELLPIRYGRMLQSPFHFYRGAAAVMAADLGAGPHTGLTAQLCGDAHVMNFGLFASPERSLVFDVNDFDETYPGPFEWDVKRLAASLAVAGRENGFSARERAAAVLEAVSAYRLRMRRFADMRVLDIWYARDDVHDLRAIAAEGGRRVLRRTDHVIGKALSRDHIQACAKLARRVDGRLRIVADPPLVVPLADLLGESAGTDQDTRVHGLLDDYAATLSPECRQLLARFRVVDVARKVVGVGSVGTRCWIVLLVGRDEGDPLLLQAKEAGPSVLADHVAAVPYDNEGRRVVAGQRLMQAAGDIFLGWQRATGLDGRSRDFYVRQLLDWKGSFPADAVRPEGLRLLARACGSSLARAHARSGDPIAVTAYLGTGDAFDRALADFAEAYADRNQRDYDALVEAARTGRVPSADG